MFIIQINQQMFERHTNEQQLIESDSECWKTEWVNEWMKHSVTYVTNSIYFMSFRKIIIIFIIICHKLDLNYWWSWNQIMTLLWLLLLLFLRLLFGFFFFFFFILSVSVKAWHLTLNWLKNNIDSHWCRIIPNQQST